MRKKVETYLEVPYKDKEEAKSLGAWWDPNEKKWYIPKGEDSKKFSKWLIKELTEFANEDEIENNSLA